MKTCVRQITSSLCMLAVGSGVWLLFAGDSSRALTSQEAQAVSGGTLNPLNYTYTNCPAGSILCTAGLCNQQTKQCPANTAEFTQTAPQYPSGTQAGTLWETTKAQQYTCRTYRFCSNPCSQSTGNNMWYCGGPVGNIFNDTPVNGIIGDKPAGPEA